MSDPLTNYSQPGTSKQAEGIASGSHLTEETSSSSSTIEIQTTEPFYGIMETDTISVQLVPEKKGLFLKHSEYEITSDKHKSTTYRRYNDFVNLHGLLIARAPFRLVPRLPPKQLMLDSLLEERRRGLQRWIRLIAQHPIFGNDPLLEHFLIDTSPDHQEHLRDILTKELDEFSNLSEDIELPLEDQGRLAASREIMRTMLNSTIKLKRLIDQQTSRTQSQGKDIEEMGSLIKLIGSRMSTTNPFTDMASGLKNVSDLSENSAVRQQNAINERLTVIIDVLTGHSDLCERVDKGVVNEHQKALSKMVNLNKQRMKGVIRGTDAESVAAIHEKEVAQTDVVGSLGRRSAFSLYCILQETQLAHSYLKDLPSVLLSFTYEQQQTSKKMAEIWQSMICTEADKLNQ